MTVWVFVFFFKQKTAYEMRMSDWSSDVCSSDLPVDDQPARNIGDLLDLDEPVLLQRAARRDEIDDAPAEPQARRQLHRAIQLDAFRLHAPRREMEIGRAHV